MENISSFTFIKIKVCSSIVPLKRYTYTHHYATISQPPIGYKFETSYYLFVAQVPNTRPLYECITTKANFVSLDLTCEGKGTYQRTSGYIYNDQNTNTNTYIVVKLFRLTIILYHLITTVKAKLTKAYLVIIWIKIIIHSHAVSEKNINLFYG